MDAVIDAVGTAREQMLDTYGKWAGELPKVVKDPKAFDQWARQFPTLHKVAAELGLDAPALDVTFTGSIRGSARSGTRPARSRPGRRSSGRGTAVSNQKILGHLAEHPGTAAKAMAKALGIGEDALRSRLATLQGEGLVTREGERNRTRWHAVQPALTGAGG